MAYLLGDDEGLGADQTWQERCRAQGGVATVDPKTGAPACRFVASKVGTKVTFRYVDVRTMLEKASYVATIAKEQAQILAGKAVDARDTAKAAVVSTVKKVAAPIVRIVAPTPVAAQPVATVGPTDGTWQSACKAKGGVVTVDPKLGTPACRLPDPANKGKFLYSDMRSLSEKLSYGATIAKEQAQITAGKVVDVRDKVAANIAKLANKASSAVTQATGVIVPSINNDLEQSKTWQAGCKAKGGVVTVDPKTGAPACRMPDPKNKGKFLYTDMRNVTEKAQDAAVFAQETRLAKQAADSMPWQDRCRAQGGSPTVDPTTGAPACRMPDKSNPAKFAYTDIRNVTEKLTDGATKAKEQAQIVAGNAVEKRDEVIKAVTGGAVDRTISAGVPTPTPTPVLTPAGTPTDDSPLSQAVRGRTPVVAPTYPTTGGGYSSGGGYSDGGYTPPPQLPTDTGAAVQEASMFGGGSMGTVLLAAGVAAAAYFATAGKKKPTPRRRGPAKKRATVKRRATTRRTARRR